MSLDRKVLRIFYVWLGLALILYSVAIMRCLSRSTANPSTLQIDEIIAQNHGVLPGQRLRHREHWAILTFYYYYQHRDLFLRGPPEVVAKRMKRLEAAQAVFDMLTQWDIRLQDYHRRNQTTVDEKLDTRRNNKFVWIMLRRFL